MKLVGAKGALLATRVRMKRRELKLKQIDISKESGLSVEAIRLIETGYREIRPHEEEKMAAALGVSMQWLRTGRE